MTVTREQEFWTLALWVDREQGDEGELFITERVLHFEATGDAGGKQLWMEVARRYIGLRSASSGQLN